MAGLEATAAPASGAQPRSIMAPTPFDAFVREHGTTPRRNIFGYFVHELGRRIVGGQYAPGSNLPNEPELVEEFSISRTVVREAMKCLAGKGLVEIKTRVGTRVRERSYWHHLDTDVMVWHYETGPSVEVMQAIKDLRRVLEPEAAARAAQRATRADLAAIRSAYAEMERSIGNMDAHADADLAFHTALFAATKNVVYAQLIDLLAVAIYANRTMAKPADVIRGQKEALGLHKAIVDAIAAADPEAATLASHRQLDSWRLAGLDD